MIGTDSYHILIEDTSATSTTSSKDDYRNSNIMVTEIDLDTLRNRKALQRGIEPIRAKLIGNGIIRIYREFEFEREEAVVEEQEKEQEIEADGKQKDVYRSETSKHTTRKKLVSKPGDDSMIAILAIPTYFTATDLLGFIGEHFVQEISHIRVLKSEKPNRFLGLIKFRDIVKAAEFQYQFDGKNFNSMEPETCHVIYVKSIQSNFSRQADEIQSMIPFLLLDPFTSVPSLSLTTDITGKSASTSKQFDLVSSNPIVELPSCPVCLERMDATITGLLTIPCQHTFHCQCLLKWRDDSCPVCRYSHSLATSQDIRQASARFRHLSRSELTLRGAASLLRRSSTAISEEAIVDDDGREGDVGVSESESCAECTERSNLWICLICGNVGCSRYAPEQHSLKHFVATGHCFAMEISTSRVWDYAGDNYVHRLITNEADGKLVELPDKDVAHSSSKSQAGVTDKVDAVGFEYSQLLISQLASQREYYEELIMQRDNLLLSHQKSSSLPDTSGDTKIDINTNTSKSANVTSISDLEARVEELALKVEELNSNVVPSLKGKVQNKEERISALLRELSTIKTLNEAFSRKIEFLTSANNDQKKIIEKLEQEKKELGEQVTDLMFFLDSKEKFKDEPEDVRQGTVVILEPQSRSTSNSTTKKKKKKSKK